MQPLFSLTKVWKLETLQRPVSRAARRTSSATDASQLRGHGYMELAANKSKTVSKSGTIQAFIKDIFV